MTIGFDAKRYYFNYTGLGNYSRGLLDALMDLYPEHDYFLFSPKPPLGMVRERENVHTILPQGIHKLFPSFWRSRNCMADLNKHVQLYHGLSNELPFGIHRSNVKSVVTIHDLIFERFPNQYKKADVAIYRKKFKYACHAADLILATSECTKKDIIDFYGIESAKIEVCYQACDIRFVPNLNKDELEAVKLRYKLPDRYILSVGSVIERKNLLNTVKALEQLKDEHLGLVIVGKGKEYADKVKNFIQEKNLVSKVLWLEDNYAAADIQSDLPMLYQMAIGLVYPSLYEGFGIPVLEAMKCNCPVITSRHSSMEEITKEAAILINPSDIDELSASIHSLNTNADLRQDLIAKAHPRAQDFSNEHHANKVMSLFKNLMSR